MNLADYVRVIMRRGWIILLAAALTAGSGYVFSKLQTPIYRSTQKVLIKPARSDFGLTQTLKQLLDGWGERLRTELRAQEAIDTLKLDMTPADLKSQVTITADVNSMLITVDADMKDGEVGNRVARTYGEQFIQWRNQENQPLQLADRINAELLDAPQYALLKPNTKINVLAGALLGVLLGGVVVFVLEFLESNVVRRTNDIERFLQLPVLGTLPDTQS
jgi:capsular polysaccharide biosynthesis protein